MIAWRCQHDVSTEESCPSTVGNLQAEALHRQFKAKKDAMEKQNKNAVMDKYGNAARVPDSDEARLLLGQTEGYVEYNAQGRVIKGQEAKVRFVFSEPLPSTSHLTLPRRMAAEHSSQRADCSAISDRHARGMKRMPTSTITPLFGVRGGGTGTGAMRAVTRQSRTPTAPVMLASRLQMTASPMSSATWRQRLQGRRHLLQLPRR